ncbi:MAG: hypothetical protein ACT4PY_04875 [Armatimonadota bacterium]
MIGVASFLIETAGVLFPLLFVAAGLAAVIRERQKAAMAAVAFGALMLALMGVRYVHQVQNRLVLNRLTPEHVAQVVLAERSVSDRHHISVIVGALREARWFSANHGGWATELPLVVVLRNGERHRFRVAYYLKQEGAIIAFPRRTGDVRWHDGYAFSRALPESLKRVGLRLPSQP